MGLHHTHDEICVLCQHKKLQAHPILASIYDRVKAKFPDTHIAWTFRDKYYQDLAYRDGRSRVRWPDSKHNAMENGLPRARAIDLFRLRPDLVAAWEISFYRDIWEFIKSSGVPIMWGGEWKKFTDSPHFQLSDDIV